MRLDQSVRVERLLARHQSIVLGEHLPGRPALYRRDELLVANTDADTVSDRARRWLAAAPDPDPSGVARVRLREAAKVDVAALAAELSGGSHPIRVSPNHVLRGEPQYGGGPYDDPAPAAVLPAPVPTSPPRREVAVAILDTGIASHDWWLDSSWYKDCGEDLVDIVDANLDLRLDSEAGHGTFVAGVLLQHAPAARLHIDRVLSSDGISDELSLVRALHLLRLRARHAGDRLDLVNLSLGGYTYDDKPNPLLQDALARFDPRTVIVACSGNAGTDRPFWPAAVKRVLAVGALDPTGTRRAEFSNYGWWVDACAVGEDVHSTFVRFDGPARPIGDYDPDLFDGSAATHGAAPAGRCARMSADGSTAVTSRSGGS